MSRGAGEFFFGPGVFPLVLVFALLGILFVLFRMNTVEIDYRMATLKRDVERAVADNKELRAVRARMLSVGRLRALAKRHGLRRPGQAQIIIVP